MARATRDRKIRKNAKGETPLQVADQRIARIRTLLKRVDAVLAAHRACAAEGYWFDDLASIEARLRELVGEEG